MDIPDKQYFKIGEVAEIAGVEPYVLRYWETEFKSIRPEKTRSNQRLYRRRDVETVLTIKLRKTTRSVRITLSAPSLRARGGKVPDSSLHRRQVVAVSVVDAAARRTDLSEKVAITGR